MTIEKALRLMAGIVILLSVALTVWVDPYWLILTAFVGLNLAQSGLTNWCPAVWMFQKLGLPACGSEGGVNRSPAAGGSS